MSTYVLMRILESAPRRYDFGMRLLSLGRLARAYDQLARPIEPGQRVLDLGCGTGTLALRAADKGASVKAIDPNPEMLAIASQRVRDAGLVEKIELAEMGVAELDREKPASYDAVMSGLCFSELSEDELTFALRQVARILKPGGVVLVADEVRPETRMGRWIYALLRAPLVALTYVLTQQTTHVVAELPRKLARAGLTIRSVERVGLPGFKIIRAEKPQEGEA